MSHRFAKVIVIIFCLFIGGGMLVSCLLPDREYSEMENRFLQAFPKFTVERVKSGRYMKELEDYVSDQVVLRSLLFFSKAFHFSRNKHHYFLVFQQKPQMQP